LVLASATIASAQPSGPDEEPHEHAEVPPPAGSGDAEWADDAPEAAAAVPPANGEVVPRPREQVATSVSRPPPAPRDHTRRRSIENTSWRQRGRFHFEIRFGPYWPEVDEEFEGAAVQPFDKVFGSDARFYFGLEVDWLPVRIPYVGTLGAAFGWGYTSASGNTIIQTSDAGIEASLVEPQLADSETSLNIMPMHVSAVLRLDGPLVRWNVPVAPYLKLGLGFAPWSATGPDGTSQTADGNNSGEDTSLGMHLALGGAIALNAFDATAAVSLREDTGIGYAYLFGEWMWANLDGIGSGGAMHVGTSTAVVGVAIDW